jgi:hypothetical protein
VVADPGLDAGGKGGHQQTLTFSCEEIDFKVNSPAGDDRLVGTAFALVEATRPAAESLWSVRSHLHHLKLSHQDVMKL